MFTTARLRIVPLGIEDAEAILHGETPPGADWAPGYPTDGTLVGAGIVVTAAAEGVDLGPWTIYQVLRGQRVVGGVGFQSRPAAGRVPVGFGETDESRAENLMPEALRALVDFAREQGVSPYADTAVTNTDTIAVLEAAGLRRVGRDPDIALFVG